jgi:hypothetical protein
MTTLSAAHCQATRFNRLLPVKGLFRWVSYDAWPVLDRGFSFLGGKFMTIGAVEVCCLPNVGAHRQAPFACEAKRFRSAVAKTLSPLIAREGSGAQKPTS